MFNPEDAVLTFDGVPVMEYMDYFEPTGIEVDPGEFIEARLSIDGEDFDIKIKREDLDYIVKWFCK